MDLYQEMMLGYEAILGEHGSYNIYNYELVSSHHFLLDHCVFINDGLSIMINAIWDDEELGETYAKLRRNMCK